MAHVSPGFSSVRDRLLKELNHTDTHVDNVERVLELASRVSPRERARMERTIGVIIDVRRAIFQSKPDDRSAKARLETARAAAQRLRNEREAK